LACEGKAAQHAATIDHAGPQPMCQAALGENALLGPAWQASTDLEPVAFGGHRS
jgi:hypothetical protein